MTISFDFDSFDYDSLYNSVFKADIRIRELMQNILSEHRTNRLYSEDMISVLLTQVVIETARSIEMNEIAVSLPTFPPSLKRNTISLLENMPEL